ncbi:hypothetical protein [Streptomyces sp. ID05-18]|uniref:hypothetical protein n=1 Tax=Streptomyces sp. ID05-18 TaxID=3028662 RepID=UPI0029B801C4|nr:hypothetical protein [Streptomyces sp. ID05-18]MDX3488531.1 hypothetical protein [Streptomyces sp. ID05-18]
MGMCIDVLIVDWDHLMSVPEDQHYAVLYEAADSVDEEWWDAGLDQPPSTGPQWFWPAPPAVSWFGKFDFGDVGYSYKDHFWAGERWEETRSFVEPGLRSAVDRFIDPLFWGGLEYMSDRNADDPLLMSGDESSAPSDHLLWCRPDAVSSLKRLWDSVGPELSLLRDPFGRHSRADFGRINDFDTFVGLLRGWGDVIDQAELRGWGVVGLRC